MQSNPAGQLRHIMLCTVGSAGDVHPFVGLGRVLRRLGYRVTIVTAGYFEQLVTKAGCEFVNPLPSLEHSEVVQNRDIWHSLRGPRTVMNVAVRPLVEPMYRAIEAHHTPGETLIVGSSLAFGARLAQDKLGIPAVTVHLSPSLFRSDFEGPRLPGMCVHRGPAWFRHLQWYLADQLVIDRMVCPWLNVFRAELGLPPVSGVYRDWWHSPLKVLAMFPQWFAAKQPDWPEQTELTGFPLYSEDDVHEPAPELVEFVESGSRPLVFTPGSANVFGHEFFQAAVEACQKLGRRGVLLTRFPEQLPRALPDNVRHFGFVPFRWLLPRADLLVHHGGIGSLSQALAAGVPQVIMPLGFDQFDNIARVEELGVGTGLPPKRFRGERLAQVIRSLLDDRSVAARCRVVKALSEESDGLENAARACLAAWSNA
ncbi:MAG: glycosyltransferase, partial [Planctomycetaceae bacterium]|nr:glycosyltransferase [Planctomycetaceae bacterium]